MGLLRLWLAFVVLASHTGRMNLQAGIFAVECFFALSGFYMQFIMAEDYAGGKGWVGKFYASRLLRIYVPYWLILLCVIAWNAGTGTQSLHDFLHKGSPRESLLALWYNIGIVGVEHLKLLRVLHDCATPMWNNLLIPQAWTVGMEVFFYALAPLLLARACYLWAALIATLLLKSWFLTHYAGRLFAVPCWDGLIDNIFPLELGIFAAGALAYRVYARYFRTKLGLKTYITLLALIIGWHMALNGIHKAPSLLFLRDYALWLAFCIAAFAPLFAASRHSRVDRLLANLSYPMYLWHIPLLKILKPHFTGSVSLTIWLFATSLALAFPVVWLVERPLARIRHRYLRP